MSDHEDEFTFDEADEDRIDDRAEKQAAKEQQQAMKQAAREQQQAAKALQQQQQREEKQQQAAAKTEAVTAQRTADEMERQTLVAHLGTMSQSPLAGQYLSQKIHGFEAICKRLGKMKLDELRQTKVLFESSLGAVSTGILSQKLLTIGTSLVEKTAGMVKPGILQGYSAECSSDVEIQLMFEVVALRRFNVATLSPEQKLCLCLAQKAVAVAGKNATSSAMPSSPNDPLT